MKSSIRVTCEAAALVDLKTLTPMQGALKTLSDEDRAKLRQSILTHGISFPVHAWRDGKKVYILDGTQRTSVLREMASDGYKIPKVPVAWIEAKNKKDAARKLLASAAQFGEVQSQGLFDFMKEFKVDLAEIKEDFRFPDIDFEKFEQVHFIVDKSKDEIEDEIPEKVEPKANLGDIYQLGTHRLMCGDSTNIQHVETLMNGEKADMVFTDPPYGVNYQKKTQEIANQSKSRFTSKIHGDDLSVDDLKEMISAAFNNIYAVLAPKSSYYVCSPQGGELGLMMMMQESGIPCRHMIIWVKNAPVFSMGRLDYDYRHEPILYGWSPKKSHEFEGGGEFKNSIWEISREPNKLHPTMKPLAIPENAIKNSTRPNGSVLDLFGGSGSTLIACEKTNRKCFMMEIDAHYCDVIIARWEKYSGKTARLLGNQSISKKALDKPKKKRES